MNEERLHYRCEYKYLVNSAEEVLLLCKAQSLLMPDAHTAEDGTYTVRSLYFDDYADTCLRENFGGTDPRSKFRIRYYNETPERLSLEKKMKIHGMCAKQSCLLTSAEYEKLIAGEPVELTDSMPEVKKALLTEFFVRGMMPKVIVTYERIPFCYTGGNVRVTFDRKISSSGDIGGFLDGTYMQRPIFPCGESLLEVKWDELLPKHLRTSLQLDSLKWTSFSKYMMCRIYHI